jgi:uncharacterized protein YndB with AHSA1/START domain
VTNESILISEVIPATPQRIFSAWMDSAQHSAFTGDEATLVNEVGGELRAAGGYIQGRTLELSSHRRAPIPGSRSPSNPRWAERW